MAERMRCRCHQPAVKAAAVKAAVHPAVARVRATAQSPALAARDNPRLQPAQLLQLQRIFGNRVAQRIARRIQRRKLTDAEKAQDLQSDALKNDARLQQAYDDSPLLLEGETSGGVKTLQRALRDLGYPMPISFAKTGDADGAFGSETKSTVYKFQVDHHLVYRTASSAATPRDA
jgi:hypothetical protein